MNCGRIKIHLTVQIKKYQIKSMALNQRYISFLLVESLEQNWSKAKAILICFPCQGRCPAGTNYCSRASCQSDPPLCAQAQCGGGQYHREVAQEDELSVWR